MISQAEFEDLLKIKNGYLFNREGQKLEFKEQFNFGGLADYLRDFAAFANNRGGMIIFGIKDSPRIPVGLSPTSLNQFQKIDPETISGSILEIFSSEISWEQATFNFNKNYFGVFQIEKAVIKPIIAKKDAGLSQQIKNADIYYRYCGRTQKIQYAELQSMIDQRVKQNNSQWIDLMSKIGKVGPENAAILDTEKALIEKGNSRVLVLDSNLAKKIKFIKEGEFVEKNGATALKLVGDIIPMNNIEIVKRIKENLTKIYPLSATELAAAVIKLLPQANKNSIWKIVKENDMKTNLDYSAFNFRNKKQVDTYKETGVLPSGIPSIYNDSAVMFIHECIEKIESLI